MKRNTEKGRQTGNDRTNVPTPDPGDISKHPSMQELKRLVGELSPDRRQALDDYLEKERSPMAERTTEAGDLSEKELLARVRVLLDSIEPAERVPGATARGRKSPLKTTVIAVRIPITLDKALQALGRPKSRHIERAIMLYLKAMKAAGGAQ